MKKRVFILLGLCILMLVACENKSVKLTGDEAIAKEYVEKQGYKITSYNGVVESYTLDKSMIYGGLKTIKYQQIWGVQKVEPEDYFGEEITTYGFTVKNHPLKSRGVNVYVMMAEGEVIGGYSFPDKDMVGAFYSIDGKTLEEISGLSFEQWSEMWSEKYK